MIKTFTLSLLILTAITTAEEDEDFDYKNMDTTELVNNVDKYFKDNTAPISKNEALDLLLLTYAETNLMEISNIEIKLQEGEELDDAEEEKLFLRVHIDDFFEERYKDQELTPDTLKEIIRTNEVLLYIEDKMKEEEYRNFHGKYDEVDEDLDDHYPDYENDEYYDSGDDLEEHEDASGDNTQDDATDDLINNSLDEAFEPEIGEPDKPSNVENEDSDRTQATSDI